MPSDETMDHLIRCAENAAEAFKYNLVANFGVADLFPENLDVWSMKYHEPDETN